VRIRGVVAGTAAAQARPALREDDLVVAVNSRPTRHLGFDALIEVFRGVRGRRVLLVVERAPLTSPLSSRETERSSSFNFPGGPGQSSPSKAWSAFDEFLATVVPKRVFAVRGGATLERLAQLAAKNLGHATEMISKRTRFVRCWDLSDSTDAGALRAAVFGPRERGVLDRRSLSRVDGRVPGLRELVAVGAAVGAWLSLDKEHVAFLGDSSGARLRVALASVAALRIGALVDDDPAFRTTDSALEAYEAFLKTASLESALPLASLPPSFRRALSHLDAAVACRDAPNPSGLLLSSVRAPAVFDFPLRVQVRHATSTADGLFVYDDKRQRRRDNTTTKTEEEEEKKNLNKADDQDDDDDDQAEYRLVARVNAVLEDDFAVTLVSDADSDPVLRFASNTAFLGPGRVSLSKAALDVFPKWRDKLPPNFAVVLDLGEEDEAKQPKKKKVLVPHDRKAILALGLEVLASSKNIPPPPHSPATRTPRRSSPQTSQHAKTSPPLGISTTPTFVQPPC